MRNEAVTIPVSETEKVSGILSIPDSGAPETGVIIAHGAGNDMNQRMLQYLAEGLADAGYPGLRFNFLYSDKGKKAPDTPALLTLAWEGAFRFLAAHPDFRIKHVITAGKSMGGRIASQMIAEGKLAAERLIFLGYPLHPPGKKDRIRDAHLYGIQIPMLFFAGTRDPLCDLDLLKGVLSRLQAPWKLEIIEGGDHSFNVPKSFATGQEAVFRKILDETLGWLER